ncbi:MAG: NFACT RNA binding domain-containing protein [Gemmatimonadaceae bacterium]
MDSLTIHYIARELDKAWRGRRVDGIVFERAQRTVNVFVDGVRPVMFKLGAPPIFAPSSAKAAADDSSRGAVISEVTAPVDDRRLEVAIERRGKFRGSSRKLTTLGISLVPRAFGALLRDAGGHKLAAIGTALPSPVIPRPVLDEMALNRAASAADMDSLLHGRWISRPIALWLVSNPDTAVERYRMLCELGPPRPSRCGNDLVPFPWCDGAQPVDSLIGSAAAVAPETIPEPAGRSKRALDRMKLELHRAAEAPSRRQAADILLGLGDVPVPESVRLENGTVVHIVNRHGSETAREAAARLYAEARSMERALATLPGKIAKAELQPEPAQPLKPRRGPTAERRDPAPAFRTYMSSGGILIRVGRGAASNDSLTFHESSPEDVWLHARGASGAHVVLGWQHPDTPPKRDLEEAGILAALHSKARGSAVVAVEWTRRKHVRKARGGAAGKVIVTHGRTITVRPDAEVERKLRSRPPFDPSR